MPSSHAYEKLRDAILRLELEPGNALTERGLESFLDTSRTTVRGALARLENEGLVTRDGRGYIVAPIDFAEISQALEFRTALETQTVKLAVERATDAQIKTLEKQLEKAPKTLDAFMKHATDFHLELARLGGNAFFTRALEDVLTRLARTRWFEANAQGGQTRASTDHKQIIERIKNRDANGAQELIKTHLERSKERLLTTLMNTQGLQIRGKNGTPRA
jgi:DNA-binding GntR family transcriptional regulator